MITAMHATHRQRFKNATCPFNLWQDLIFHIYLKLQMLQKPTERPTRLDTDDENTGRLLFIVFSSTNIDFLKIHTYLYTNRFCQEICLLYNIICIHMYLSEHPLCLAEISHKKMYLLMVCMINNIIREVYYFYIIFPVFSIILIWLLIISVRFILCTFLFRRRKDL